MVEKREPPKVQLPPEILKYISKDAPKKARMLAAKALVPMSPTVQLTVLYFLTSDADPSVAEAAKNTLLGLPLSMLKKTLSEPLHPKILDFFAREKKDEYEILEPILLNKYVDDETLICLAPQVDERAAQLIAGNQQRLLENPEIGSALKKNNKIPRNIIDRVVSFLRVNGIILEGESAELTQDEIKQILKDAPSPEALEEGKEEEAGLFPAEVLFDDDKVDEEAKKNILKKISEMTVSEKVKLALLGNKEARAILIKDPNKVVATAVVKSPRLKENEVINIAQMRSVDDEVIRIIARNPEWTRNYAVQLALVNNPKTPLQRSMQFVKNLRVNDLKQLAKNKNIPSALSKIAKELYNKRR